MILTFRNSKLTKASTGYNPIVELAKETGTPLHLWKESTLLIDGDGHPVASSEANKALKKVWEILEAAIEHSMLRNEEIHHSASLLNFFESWCNQAVEAGKMNKREMVLVLGMSQMWGAYVGDDVELQSLKYFYLEDCINGGSQIGRCSLGWADFLDDCFIPTNYQKIMARVSAAPLAQAHIFLDTVMVSVEARMGGPRPVCLTTSDNRKQYFDDVVVTVPLGWLKQHKESIRGLHPRIESAINSISFGRLEKVHSY